MSKTRNNHYVPQWYQEGFFEPGQTSLAYLDLSPEQFDLPNGHVKYGRSNFVSPTSRCFVQRDLYSTFFGTKEQPNLPSRSVFQVAGLASPAFLVEIEVTAVRP